jgi:hypothetical protein
MDYKETGIIYLCRVIRTNEAVFIVKHWKEYGK